MPAVSVGASHGASKNKPVDIDTKEIERQRLDSQEEEDGLDDWSSVQRSIDREARLERAQAELMHVRLS